MLLSLLCLFVVADVEKYDCGTRALYTALRVCDVDCSPRDVASAITELAPDGKTDSLAALAAAARRFGRFGVAVSYPRGALSTPPRGAVVHVRSRDMSGHYLTFLGTTPHGVILADAPIPPFLLSHEAFHEEWTGAALLLFSSVDEVAAFQAATRDAQIRRRVSLSLLFAGAMIVVVRALRWRRSRKWSVLAAAIALVCSTGCSERRADRAERVFPCVIRPASSVDAGFVPPGGKELRLTIENTTSVTVELNQDVRPTCGCTHVSVPNSVNAHGSGAIIVGLDGDRAPLTRVTQFLLRTTSGARLPVSVRFITGDLPCLTPRVVELSKDGKGTLLGSALLWFHAPSAGNAAVTMPRESKVKMVLREGDGYVKIGPASINVTESGLVGIRLELRAECTAGSLAQSGQESLELCYANRSVRIPYTYALSRPIAVFIQPQTISFLVGEPDAARRVVLVRTPGPGVCSVVAKPSFVTVQAEPLTDTCLKLVVTSKGTIERSASAGELTVRYQPETGTAIDASCDVELLSAERDLEEPSEIE